MPFVYFSLRAKTEKERKTADKIIRDLKKTFGKDNVEVNDFEMWKSVGIDGVQGWVGIADIGYNDKSRFHIHTPSSCERKVSYDVPLEACDTIYNM